MTTAAEFADTILFYAQLTVAALLVMTDGATAAWYAVALVAVWMLVQRPPAPLPPAVLELTPYELQVARESPTGGSAAAGSRPRWIVLAGWRRADYLLPEFCALATAARDAGTRFGYVDLQAFPEAAVDLGVELGPMSMQVPSVFLLEAGQAKPTKRLPYLDAEGNAKNIKLDRKAIAIFFNVV